MLALKPWLAKKNISQAELARAVNVSPSTLAQLLNKEIWPKQPDKETLTSSICKAIHQYGYASLDARLFKTAHMPTKARALNNPNQEVIDMLLRKQTLTQAAKQHFQLFKDPFSDDVTDAADVFMTPDIRYVREYLWSATKNPDFIAIVAESGAGKTTLRRDLIDRIQREDAPIVVMEPYVLGMEDNDIKGKTLKAASIADAMIASLAPLEKPRRSMEAKGRQLHRLLKESRKAGMTHVLIIEEAHGLSVPTLKHLKRFFELEDGFKKLLSIILIGQTELKTKLSERAPEVREVVQRCEVVQLNPLDARLDEYLQFKFKRVGKDLSAVFDADALDGIRARLIFTKSSKSHETVSLMYPLMVNNLVTAALNKAATLGFDTVSGDLIREV